MRVNSAKVAGGAAPPPEHSRPVESQSPVRQENFPVVASWAQPVRPHRRPDQEAGKGMAVDSPGWRAKPVVGSWVVPAPERKPGHTV